MELKPGHKLTEVGVIPEDWEVSSLGKCCSKITDGTHDTPQQVRSGVPYLTAIHVKKNYIDFENCYFLPESIHAEIFKRCNPEQGDVLMVNIGAGVATTALVNVNYEFSLKNVALLKPNTQKLVGEYLNQSQIYRKETIAKSLLSGGAQPFLSLSQIGRIKIALPPEPEQRSIATALSDMDELLGGLDRLITKKRDLKQSAMQQLLTGNTRLMGFGGRKSYKQTEVGLIPEDWKAAQLGDVAEVIMGQSPKGSSYNKNGNGTALINGPTEFTDKHPIQIQWTTEPTKLCRAGDLLLCVRGSSTGRMNVSTGEFCIGRGVAAIRANDQSVKDYLTYQVNLAIEKLLALSTGSTFPSVDGKAIKSIFIPCPEPEEQIAIASILSDMDTEIATLEQRRNKTRDLKQAMMQELLTGRIRLL